jgi:hypothetical protein
MEFLLGLLVGVVFFLCVILAYWLGTKQSKHTAPKEMDKQQRDELKRYNDHFKKLFTYDVEKAIQRKKVT